MSSGSPPVGEAKLGALFSIDVDAELAKICGRGYSSPHHYPVELVRAALARGATRVALRLSGRRLEIEDDGAAIGSELVTSLAQLLDRAAPAEQRQQALYEVEQPADAGLLAALAPAPSALELLTGDGRGASVRLCWQRGQLVRDERPGGRHGTAIAITRRGDPEQERAVLCDYCRFAGAEILVDGTLISGRAESGALAHAAVVPWGAVRRCDVELPADGELCRVFRLVHGIVKQRWTGESAPRFVYQVAVECAGELPGDFVEHVLVAARALYQEVASRYPQLAAAERDRVDELFFRHYRAERTTPLFDRLAVFRRHGGQRLTLAEVQHGASQGLCAVVEGEDLARYDLADAEVVELTPRQKDFLEHDVGLALPAPLLRPSLPGRWRSGVAALCARARRTWRALAVRLSRGPHVSAPEEAAARLCAAMQSAIAAGRFALPQAPKLGHVDVVWSDRRGRPCVVTIQGDRATLLFNAGHRLVQQAVRAYARDIENLVFILPALLDGHDGWQV